MFICSSRKRNDSSSTVWKCAFHSKLLWNIASGNPGWVSSQSGKMSTRAQSVFNETPLKLTRVLVLISQSAVCPTSTSWKLPKLYPATHESHWDMQESSGNKTTSHRHWENHVFPSPYLCFHQHLFQINGYPATKTWSPGTQPPSTASEWRKVRPKERVWVKYRWFLSGWVYLLGLRTPLYGMRAMRVTGPREW